MSARLYIDPVGGVDYIIETIPDGVQFIGDKLANHGKDGDHIFSGIDAVDGDQLGIDFVPSTYVRDTSPAEVTNVKHLTAHLKGIDTAISTAAGITGSGTTGTIPKFTAATVLGDSLITETTNRITIGPSAGLSVLQGTIASAALGLLVGSEWNNAGVTFTHIKSEVTDTASAAGSLLLNLTVGGVTKFTVRKDGAILDSSAVRSADFLGRELQDSSDVTSVNWTTRVLKDSSAVERLNWETQVMTGGWTIDGVDIDAHESRHRATGADTINVEDLGTTETDKTKVLRSDGAGGLLWENLGILNNFNVTTSDATLTTIATLTLDAETTLTITVTVSAKRTNIGEGRGGFIRAATAYREGGAAALQGEVETPLTRSDQDYEVSITTSGNDVLVQVKGLSGHDVEWLAVIVEARVS